MNTNNSCQFNRKDMSVVFLYRIIFIYQPIKTYLNIRRDAEFGIDRSYVSIGYFKLHVNTVNDSTVKKLADI